MSFRTPAFPDGWVKHWGRCHHGVKLGAHSSGGRGVWSGKEVACWSSLWGLQVTGARTAAGHSGGYKGRGRGKGRGTPSITVLTPLNTFHPTSLPTHPTHSHLRVPRSTSRWQAQRQGRGKCWKDKVLPWGQGESHSAIGVLGWAALLRDSRCRETTAQQQVRQRPTLPMPRGPSQ